jgi:hypothetical protein
MASELNLTPSRPLSRRTKLNYFQLRRQTQNPIHAPNFSSYSRSSRFNNFRRGVALLIDSNINSIKHDLPPHLSDLEAVAADAQLNNKTITIISYYNSAFQALTDIFNNCMKNLYFPTAWKTAHTVMIPKPGKYPNDPKS